MKFRLENISAQLCYKHTYICKSLLKWQECKWNKLNSTKVVDSNNSGHYTVTLHVSIRCRLRSPESHLISLSLAKRWASLRPWTEWTGWVVWRRTTPAKARCLNCQGKKQRKKHRFSKRVQIYRFQYAAAIIVYYSKKDQKRHNNTFNL